MAKYKEDRINRSIDTFEEIINYEKSKIAEDELDDLHSMIKRLTRLISTTEREIDRHYYYCYGEGSVSIERTGNVLVYIIRD